MADNLVAFDKPSVDSVDPVDQFLYEYIENNNVDTTLLDLEEIYNNPSAEYMIKLPLVLLICRHEYNNKLGKGMIGYEEMFSQNLF